MKRRRSLLSHPGLLSLLCAFGLFLFYWPFLYYPQEWRQPHTAVYFFLAWALVILLILLVSRASRPGRGREQPSPPLRQSRDD